MTLTIAPPLPNVDAPPFPAESHGDAIGDEILLSAAASEKTQRVPSNGRRSTFESPQVRAWSHGGNVD